MPKETSVNWHREGNLVYGFIWSLFGDSHEFFWK